MGQARRCMSSYGDEFRRDRDRDFLRSDSANVEANRSVHAIKEVGVQTLLL